MAPHSDKDQEDRVPQARLTLDLRQKGIANTVVLKAIEKVDRGQFVADGLEPFAYDHRQLPLPCGQTSLSPLEVALMLEALKPQSTDHILVVGAGLGYIPAVLSHIVKKVYVVERYMTLLSEAEQRFRKTGRHNIISRQGNGCEGWEENGPYDGILLLGSVKTIPDALISQIRRPARIVYPSYQNDHSAHLAVRTFPKTGGWEEEVGEELVITPLMNKPAKAL